MTHPIQKDIAAKENDPEKIKNDNMHNENMTTMDDDVSGPVMIELHSDFILETPSIQRKETKKNDEKTKSGSIVEECLPKKIY